MLTQMGVELSPARRVSWGVRAARLFKMDIHCPKCDLFLDPTCFAKDKRRIHGLDAICKDCRRKYRQANKHKELERWKRNYNDKKHKARIAARWEFSAKEFICAVIGCEATAQELAHLDYEKPKDVIPLCEMHHTLLDKN